MMIYGAKIIQLPSVIQDIIMCEGCGFEHKDNNASIIYYTTY